MRTQKRSKGILLTVVAVLAALLVLDQTRIGEIILWRV